MNKSTSALDRVRDQILSDPDVILEDRDVMKALVAANEKNIGGNIVDLRGVAMERLEDRFDRLEDTHRNVIAAAYENLAGTNQIQRAVLALLEPHDFTEFLLSLTNEVAEIMKVDKIKLCLESPASDVAKNGTYGDAVGFFAPGSIEEYLNGGRNISSRLVTLRQVSPASETLYGEKASWIQSEALLRLDLGSGKLPGMLAMGSEDPHQFHPNQGIDLLSFFSGVFERTLRRWLA